MTKQLKTPATHAELDWDIKLGFLLHDVSRLRRSLFDRCLKPMGVTRAQWWVLAYLSREDGGTQQQLASALDIGKVAIGGLIDRLESNGLVERRPDASDRRVKRIFLADRSRVLLDEMRRLSVEMNAKIVRGLAADELDAAVRVLLQMKSRMLGELASDAEAAAMPHVDAENKVL